jgi:tetratricopeptide (TPR) repeat protein
MSEMQAKPGRNDPCPCGSGKKYKKCCAQAASAADTAQLIGMASAGRYVDLEAAAGRLVTEHPGCGIAWKALGVALRMQGKEALPALEAAAKFLPDDAEAHSNLGGALRSAGRFDEAVASYRRALAIKPAAAEIHSNLGNALKDLGRLEDAMAAFMRALELKPDLAQAHNNLGNTLQDLGRFDEAAASYRCAIALKFDYAEAYNNLAIVLRLQNRSADAEISCSRALEINPRYVPAITLRAELQADRGQFGAAEQSFHRALSIEPGCADAWAGIAGLRKMTSGDAAWLAELQRIADAGPSPRQEVDLRYALGKCLDDLQDFEPAFVNYRRANELAKTLRAPHDRAAVTRAVDHIIESHDGAWLAAAIADSDPSERPVLIVGMPRSGTTLAEQILASHRDIHGAGEQGFWNTASQAYESARLGGRNDAGQIRRIAGDYLRLLDELSIDALRVVDKMPANFLYLGLIHAALPGARIIHMRRDPLDTCLSIYFQRFGSLHTYANDLEDLAHYHSEYLRLMAHWRRILPPHAILDVAYEELVADHERSTRRMLDFIGLPWDPNCLDFRLTSRSVSTFSKWQARQAISSSSVGRWRHYEKFIGPLLRLHQSGAPP